MNPHPHPDPHPAPQKDLPPGLCARAHDTHLGVRHTRPTHLQHGVHLPASWHHQECRARSSPMDTRVVIEARPGHEPLEVVVPGRGVVPFRHLRSEEDIIRVLARGTDAFAGIYDPRHRNA